MTRQLIANVLWVTFAVALFVVALQSLPARAAIRCAGTSLLASYYGQESGNRTADGSYFDGSSLTAAMPSRSHLGERWRVTYRGRSVTVQVNDVGPAAYLHRDIDLSRAAAERIGMIGAGIARVCAERL